MDPGPSMRFHELQIVNLMYQIKNKRMVDTICSIFSCVNTITEDDLKLEHRVSISKCDPDAIIRK